MLAVTFPAWGNIYQWTDDSGTTHFSDVYQANAKIVTSPKPTIEVATPSFTKNAAEIPAPAIKNSENKPITENNTYKKILIKQPNDQETLQHIEEVKVALSLEPKLKNGDKIIIYLDDKEITQTTNLLFAIKNVERGEHNLQAKIIDKNSTILLASPTITFYVHQTSLLN
jgi:hypothetical protein